MQAEQAKEPGPGAGLCPGYTISRAILADAVALTRGDRFLTSDLTRMSPFPLYLSTEHHTNAPCVSHEPHYLGLQRLPTRYV